MATRAERAAGLHAARLAEFGEPIQYRGVRGSAQPINAVAILDRSAIAQSSAPGYFGDIEVDPAVVTAPEKGDVVVWADGVEYVVARITRAAYGLTRLAIHRRDDPVEAQG